MTIEEVIGFSHDGESLPPEAGGIPLAYLVAGERWTLMCSDCANRFVRDTGCLELLEVCSLAYGDEQCTECEEAMT